MASNKGKLKNKDKISKTVSEETPRMEDRIRFQTAISFRSNGGIVFHGQTTDVSFSGAFLYIGAKPLGVYFGERGVAAVVVKESQQEFEMVFPCAIARITETGLGLTFDIPD